jgi:hypothetical protein
MNNDINSLLETIRSKNNPENIYNQLSPAQQEQAKQGSRTVDNTLSAGNTGGFSYYQIVNDYIKELLAKSQIAADQNRLNMATGILDNPQENLQGGDPMLRDLPGYYEYKQPPYFTMEGSLNGPELNLLEKLNRAVQIQPLKGEGQPRPPSARETMLDYNYKKNIGAY